MLCEFNAAEVEYLLVGAYALAAHGLPRATGDLDLWVRPTSENARRVELALSRFGALREGISATDFETPNVIFQIGIVPVRIDIITSIDGVEFENAAKNCDTKEISGLSVPVLSRNDLLVNKRASGRPKDLADAAWLEQTADDPPLD
jgi:hypothetical protein